MRCCALCEEPMPWYVEAAELDGATMHPECAEAARDAAHMDELDAVDAAMEADND
jgi:hypothetical protein